MYFPIFLFIFARVALQHVGNVNMCEKAAQVQGRNIVYGVDCMAMLEVKYFDYG